MLRTPDVSRTRSPEIRIKSFAMCSPDRDPPPRPPPRPDESQTFLLLFTQTHKKWVASERAGGRLKCGIPGGRSAAGNGLLIYRFDAGTRKQNSTPRATTRSDAPCRIAYRTVWFRNVPHGQNKLVEYYYFSQKG